MSSDGHAYIGILTLNDGRCINVSLPERQSQRLLNKPEQQTTIVGQVFSFPHDDDALGVQINGRAIGYGLCGDKFVFVK